MLRSYIPDNYIAEANQDDFEEIVEVWEASVRATHHFLRESDILYFKPLILNEYLSAVQLVCVRNESGQIEGFIGTSEDKIEMLFLHPTVRGKGIGRKLVAYAIDHLGIRKVDVNEQKEEAVGFYKRLGFTVINRSDLDSMGKPYPLLSMKLRN
jgi:putative acetyltransferase